MYLIYTYKTYMSSMFIKNRKKIFCPILSSIYGKFPLKRQGKYADDLKRINGILHKIRIVLTMGGFGNV